MPDLERVQQNTPLTLSQQWSEDGAAVDPGTVTLGIDRADGTVLVAAGTATSGSGTSPRTFNLTTTHTALLDTLEVTWTSTLKGSLLSYVEVAGGFLFSIAQARAVSPLNNTTAYPTATIVQMRTTVEQALEDACGVAFVPRYRLETLSGPGGTSLLLAPRTTAIRSATVSDTVLAAGDLTDLTYSPTGFVDGYAWTYGSSNITVGYEHGWPSPPERIRRAALTLAKAWLVEGPVDDRASTFSSVDGGTYGLVVEGRAGSQFGLPTVDAAVNQYSLACGIA
jgi:hypothetical protein